MHASDYIITSKHYLVIFVSTFASGIYFAVRFGIITSLMLAFALLIFAVLTSLILHKQGRATKKHIFISSLLVIATLLGIFRIYCAEHIQNGYLRKYDGKEAWLCGTVANDPQTTSSGYYYTFELDVFGIADQTGNFGTVMMYLPISYTCNLTAGDNIYAWTKLENPAGGLHSYQHDYITHLRGKNIFMTGTAQNINLLSRKVKTTPVDRLNNSGAWLRRKITHSIDSIFSNDTFYGAVLKGILVGDKSGFDNFLYQRFSYSGISHIVAVSGLHMSILFSFLMIASKGFNVSKKLNLLITIPAILLFVSASAFTPSVCRASIMIIIMICSTLFREEYNPVTSLFLALGLIIAAAPYSLFSKSLILSFTATLGIFVYFPLINQALLNCLISPRLKLNKCKPFQKCLRYLSSSISLSLSSLIGTAYFLVLFFGSISKAQLFTNLWVIPIVTVIFCLGYACCILYYICPWLVTILLKYPLAWSLEIIKLTVDKFSIADNVLIISSENLSGITAIIYFGMAFMLYLTLKAFKDIRDERTN